MVGHLPKLADFLIVAFRQKSSGRIESDSHCASGHALFYLLQTGSKVQN